MHLSRYRRMALVVALMIGCAPGCQNPGNRTTQFNVDQTNPVVDNQIRMTRDPQAATTTDVSPVPQRLSSVSGTKEKDPVATTATKQVAEKKQVPEKKQVAAKSQVSAAKTASAKTTSVKAASAKTAQKTTQTTKPATKLTTRKPTRSEAVEALLAANKKSSSKPQAKKSPSSTTAKVAAKRSSKSAPNVKAPTKASANSSAVDRIASTSQARSDAAVKQVAAFEPIQAAAKPKPKKPLAFRDLSPELKQRALTRLIQNLAKNAEQSSQPDSLNAAIERAMSDLPELPDFKQTEPTTPPNRIAGANTPPSSLPSLQDIEVTELNVVMPSKGTVPEELQTPHPVVVAEVASMNISKAAPALAKQPTRAPSLSLPPIEAPSVAATTKESPASPSDQPHSKSASASLAPAAIAEANVPKQSVGENVMPPIPTVADSPVVAGNRTSQPMLLPESTSLTLPAKPLPQAYAPPPIQSVVSSTRAGVVSEAELANIDLAMPPISQEITRLPDPIVQKRFGFSNVQLPGMNEFGLGSVQQVASDTQSSDHHDVTRIAATPEPPQPGSAPLSFVPKASQQAPADSVVQQNYFQMPLGALDAVGEKPASETPATQPAPKVETIVVQSPPAEISDKQLYEMLLKRLSNSKDAETDTERSRRQIMAQHLMVLSGDGEVAAAHIDGLSKQEQQYLQHQLEALSAIVDPKGHPVVGRRFSDALPKLREATRYLSAAADKLEVRSLEFCTEIEAYGQIKPFPNRRFMPGQQVILYCEVENFVAKQDDSVFLTHLKGRYDVYDDKNQKVVSQVLPADQQSSRNYLRDYFIAYQMNLPKKLAPGDYRLELTLEDVHAEKYGQAKVPFTILK